MAGAVLQGLARVRQPARWQPQRGEQGAARGRRAARTAGGLHGDTRRGMAQTGQALTRWRAQNALGGPPHRCSFLICVLSSPSNFSFCAGVDASCTFCQMSSNTSWPSATDLSTRSISPCSFFAEDISARRSLRPWLRALPPVDLKLVLPPPSIVRDASPFVNLCLVKKFVLPHRRPERVDLAGRLVAGPGRGMATRIVYFIRVR